jgi:hypothetical protein
MIDWLTIAIALIIIASLVGFFGFLAWKMNMSDPLISNDNNQLTDSTYDKKRKEKNSSEQAKKKRKEQKKSKRENKDEDGKQQQKRNKPLQISDESDDERDESEQELLIAPTQTIETSSKARKRNKNKTQSTTTSTEVNTKNPITTRAPPATHPKSTSKDELESTKQQTKVQPSNKPTAPASLSTTTTKKPPQPVQKQQQQDQPFTVVGGNRHKTATPPPQNKSQVSTTVSVAPVQQSSSAQVQHEQLAQRQSLPQKETLTPLNVPTTHPVPVKQQVSTVSPKIADLIKVLPSSQVVVTELMSALDAFPLSTDELDIIMHKIANKQSVIKQDWNKLQHGQKVDPQAHIGQVLDESARAYEDDMKNNSMKRIKELTDELNTEKRRNNDLLKDKSDKEREIQILHAQLDSVLHKHESTPSVVHPQQKLQTLELQLKRITEENIHLNHQLSQQQQQFAAPNPGDSSNMQVHVLSEQIKKLSVDNANLEKKAHSNELLAKEAQKEHQNLIRYNEQLTQSLQKAEKDLKHTEEKYHQQLNDTRTSYFNEINEYKLRIQQLESDNEQLKREEIVHVEPTTATDIQTITVNNEEREQFEKEIQQLKQTIDFNQEKEREFNDFKQKLIGEIEEYKKKFENLESQNQSQENEIERLKKDKNNEQQQIDESRNNELNTLRTELTEVKSQSDERLRQEREKQRQILSDLLSQDLRNQLPNDNQDFDQWFSSYRQLFESNKRTLQEESASLKHENDQLNKNMTEIGNQLKEIEKTVQSKEETLVTELKNKDAILETICGKNEQLNGELQRLQQEIQLLQSARDASVSEARALKIQLDERFLVAANTPSIVAADESFELVKQPSPSLSPIVIDIRAGQLNELIRSSKEALENQDSLAQQIDKHLNEMHQSGFGETSASTGDDSTVSSSSDQQS